jgi:hypothetical protein
MVWRPNRKLYLFHVEEFDAARESWSYCGIVLLPDNATRVEVAHALKVFGMACPRGSDRVSWSYAMFPGPDGKGPLPRPRAHVQTGAGAPICRLVVRSGPVCRVREGG